MREQEEVELLVSKKARLVMNRKRAKKLKNRGEFCWWSHYFGGWLWKPVVWEKNFLE